MKIESNSDKSPLISVIIPTYNYGHYIQKTLVCLQTQTYQNWEAIIIDDGSTDMTKELLEFLGNFDKRIRYIYKQNAGLAAARNTGMSYAKGDLIQFLDADDLISTEKLAIQASHMMNHADCDISYCEAEYFDNKNPGKFFKNRDLIDIEWMPKVSGEKDQIVKNLILTNIMPVNSALIRKSFIDSNKLGFNVEMKFLEDWEFWINCAFMNASFQFVANNEALAIVRVHGDSMSKNRIQMQLFELKMRKEINNLLKATNWTSENFLRKLNIKQMDIRYREILREGRLFTYGEAKILFPEMDFIHFLKLKIKDWNLNRKNISHSISKHLRFRLL